MEEVYGPGAFYREGAWWSGDYLRPFERAQKVAEELVSLTDEEVVSRLWVTGPGEARRLKREAEAEAARLKAAADAEALRVQALKDRLAEGITLLHWTDAQKATAEQLVQQLAVVEEVKKLELEDAQAALAEQEKETPLHERGARGPAMRADKLSFYQEAVATATTESGESAGHVRQARLMLGESADEAVQIR